MNKQLFKLMLTPSWLSGLIAVAVGLATSLGALFLTQYRGSNINFIVLNYHTVKQPTGGIFNNQAVQNLPLFCFWLLVGVVVYMLAINVYSALQHTAELRDEMDYVNVDRHLLVRGVLVQLLIRLLVLVVWVPYIIFFFHSLVPYVLTAGVAAAGTMSLITGAEYMFVSFGVMALAMHIHTILFRMLLLRPRVFSRALYINEHRL